MEKEELRERGGRQWQRECIRWSSNSLFQQQEEEEVELEEEEEEE